LDNNLYAVLGLDKTASQDEIRKAYRRLAQQMHPDKHGGDADACRLFQRIKEAYETLFDADRRKQYDTTGTVGIDPVDQSAKSALMALFREIIERMVMDENADFSSLLKTKINSAILNNKKVLRDNKKASKLIKNLKKRVKYNGDGNNLFSVIVDDQIATIKRQMEQQELQIKTMNRSLEMLSEYENVSGDGGTVKFFQHFGTGSTTTTTGYR